MAKSSVERQSAYRRRGREAIAEVIQLKARIKELEALLGLQSETVPAPKRAAPVERNITPMENHGVPPESMEPEPVEIIGEPMDDYVRDSEGRLIEKGW
jgi:hypothetical protein